MCKLLVRLKQPRSSRLTLELTPCAHLIAIYFVSYIYGTTDSSFNTHNTFILKTQLLIFLLVLSIHSNAQDYLRLLNDTVPDITFVTLSGKKYNTHELKGNIIIMNFWYTHCPPCVAELPDFDTLQQAYQDKQVVFLYLSKDTEIATRELLAKKNLTLDAVPNTEKTHALFEIKMYPTTVIIDKEGIIRKSYVTVPQVRRFLKEQHLN